MFGPALFYTAELPYRDVDKDLKSDNSFSCIVPGIYPVKFVMSPKRGRNIYQLENTGHRVAIQIHSGNYAGDVKLGWESHVEGCILLGNSIGELLNKNGNMQKAVVESKSALARFETLMNHEPFTLIINERFEKS